MARNEEKAQSMLSRYLRTSRGGETRRRRPYLATLCDDVDEAEKWRLQVLRDIRRQVEEIQNPGLDEAKARELNDNINKLLRERGHWERRIRFLGGKDHTRRRKDQSDISDGVFEYNGYFYFGAARNLPGVQELIQRDRDLTQQEDEGESAASLSKRLDAAYFGYMDKDVESLEQEERDAEEKGTAALVKRWEEENDGGPNDEWDDTFIKYIGKKPAISNEQNLQALSLERKKAEAIEQLELGSQGRKEAK